MTELFSRKRPRTVAAEPAVRQPGMPQATNALPSMHALSTAGEKGVAHGETSWAEGV